MKMILVFFLFSFSSYGLMGFFPAENVVNENLKAVKEASAHIVVRLMARVDASKAKTSCEIFSKEVTKIMQPKEGSGLSGKSLETIMKSNHYSHSLELYDLINQICKGKPLTSPNQAKWNVPLQEATGFLFLDPSYLITNTHVVTMRAQKEMDYVLMAYLLSVWERKVILSSDLIYYDVEFQNGQNFLVSRRNMRAGDTMPPNDYIKKNGNLAVMSGKSNQGDYAVIKIPASHGIKPLEARSSELSYGAKVYTFGYPGKTADRFPFNSDGKSLYEGVGVYAPRGLLAEQVHLQLEETMENPIQYADQANWSHFLAFTADCYFGNSGGPLVDEEGKVVAVVSASTDFSVDRARFTHFNEDVKTFNDMKKNFIHSIYQTRADDEVTGSGLVMGRTEPLISAPEKFNLGIKIDVVKRWIEELEILDSSF